MAVQCHDPPSFKVTNPHYASYTTARISPTATLVTVAGQVAEDPETGEVPTEFDAQIDLCLQRISTCLEDAGARMTDVTRMVYYIRQGAIDDYDKLHGQGSALGLIVQHVGHWLHGHRPASCYVRSFGMSEDKFMCEFEVMAIVTRT